MAELSDYLNLRNLLVAGGITAAVVLGACGGEGPQNMSPKDQCNELKREEFIPYGGSFTIRDIYDGELTDVMKITLPKGILDMRPALMEVLVKPRASYSFFIKQAKEGYRVTHGPPRCFDLTPTPSPIDPNHTVASVHQQLNPHMYGGKDGRMPLNPT